MISISTRTCKCSKTDFVVWSQVISKKQSYPRVKFVQLQVFAAKVWFGNGCYSFQTKPTFPTFIEFFTTTNNGFFQIDFDFDSTWQTKHKLKFSQRNANESAHHHYKWNEKKKQKCLESCWKLTVHSTLTWKSKHRLCGA